MKIDPNKKYTTRDGRPVTLLHRLPDGWPTKYPIIGVVGEFEMSWTDDGKEDHSSEIESDDADDLIEVREPVEVLVVVTSANKVWGIAGRETADWYDRHRPDNAPHRIATFREVISTSETP